MLALALNLVTLGAIPSANAGLVGSLAYAQTQNRDQRVARVQSFLNRDNVAKQLVTLGVDPAEATARVAALTDVELISIEQHIDTLPAGGDSFLAVVGIIFVVIIVLDLLGVTDVFKKI
jgi:hypothetical protein